MGRPNAQETRRHGGERDVENDVDDVLHTTMVATSKLTPAWVEVFPLTAVMAHDADMLLAGAVHPCTYAPTLIILRVSNLTVWLVTSDTAFNEKLHPIEVSHPS